MIGIVSTQDILDKLKAEGRTYRKKPVTVRAYQHSGQSFMIETLEGIMTAKNEDWIIEGIHGELYPCNPAVFEKTYEPVS